jgi:hypothetical protein
MDVEIPEFGKVSERCSRSSYAARRASPRRSSLWRLDFSGERRAILAWRLLGSRAIMAQSIATGWFGGDSSTMSTVNEIIILQRRLRRLDRKWGQAEEESEELISSYGDLDAIDARLAEINSVLSETIRVAADEHEELDDRHNGEWSSDGHIVRWQPVNECYSCKQIMEAHGVSELVEEKKDLRSARRRLQKLHYRCEEFNDEVEVLRNEVNRLGQALGLPSFDLHYDEYELVGFIIQTGSVTNFSIGGRKIVKEGAYINYDVAGKTARAIFNTSGQLAAYHTGDNEWKLAETQVKTYPGPVNGQYSTTFSPHGNPDEDPGHGHVVVDEQGNVIYAREHRDYGGEEGWEKNSDKI